MKYLFLALFVISSVVHLYGSYIDNRKMRAWSKGFILLGLLGWYCCSALSVSWMVVTAILASWLGDMLLIPKGIKWFTAGGISFMVSHFFFALVYWPNIDFSSLPVWGVFAAGLFYCTIVVLVFRGLRPHLPHGLFYPMFFYLLINGTMNCFALYQLMSIPCTSTIVTFIGAVLFFMSDSILFYVRFKKDSVWKNHFLVMLTYIFAEFLIVQGIMTLA